MEAGVFKTETAPHFNPEFNPLHVTLIKPLTDLKVGSGGCFLFPQSTATFKPLSYYKEILNERT